MTNKINGNKVTTHKEFWSMLGLLLAALFWGISYPLTKFVESCPTFYIISIRFIVAAILMAIIFHRHFKNTTLDIIKYAFLLSFCLTAVYAFSTIGIKYTTSVRASFFTSLTFLIVPILNLIIFRIKLGRITIISVLICLVGAFMLCYSPNIGSIGLNIGDVLCVLGAVAGSLQIILIEKATQRKGMDSVLFTVYLMAFVALWSTIIELFTGHFSYNNQITTIEFTVIIVLGIFCSAAAFLLQSLCQKYIPSNRVGVILAAEPASGCILSVILIGETMAITGWVGAALIMVSLLYMEIATNMANNKALTIED